MIKPISTNPKLEAIASGLERSKELHFTKDYDIAITIKIALDAAGYKIIRKR